MPGSAEEILGQGNLCYLAVRRPLGPHVTPVVFAFHAGRLWGTTARRTVKVRMWRRDPRAAGLVRWGGLALSFRGSVTTYDALDPGTWAATVRRAPSVAGAWLRFTLKNAPFFAGYALDARRIPLSWTPPGRVLFSVDIEDGAVLDPAAGEVLERWGRWGARARSGEAFRPTRGRIPERGLPAEVREAVGEAGDGVLALDGSGGLAVLPARWTRASGEGAYYAILARRLLALAGSWEGRGALVVDRASRWRAADMKGLLVRGPADGYVLTRIGSGRDSLMRRAERAGPLPEEPAVVRIRPDVVVWWRGWASGTVGRRRSGGIAGARG
ncbi:MAG: pyridoxamine 5'-phosphate oxidase family protein [Actinomycetota bacterium]